MGAEPHWPGIACSTRTPRHYAEAIAAPRAQRCASPRGAGSPRRWQPYPGLLPSPGEATRRHALPSPDPAEGTWNHSDALGTEGSYEPPTPSLRGGSAPTAVARSRSPRLGRHRAFLRALAYRGRVADRRLPTPPASAPMRLRLGTSAKSGNRGRCADASADVSRPLVIGTLGVGAARGHRVASGAGSHARAGHGVSWTSRCRPRESGFPTSGAEAPSSGALREAGQGVGERPARGHQRRRWWRVSGAWCPSTWSCPRETPWSTRPLLHRRWTLSRAAWNNPR